MSKDQDNLSKIYSETSFYGIPLSNDKEQLADYQHPNSATPALTFSKTANGPGAGKHTAVRGGPGYHSNEEDTSNRVNYKYKVGDIIFGKLDPDDDISNFYKIDKLHDQGIFSFVSWYRPNSFLEGGWVEESTIWKNSEDLDEDVSAGNIIIYRQL